MASKVLVKIPVAPFGHVNKGTKLNDASSEILAIGGRTDVAASSKSMDPILRVAQLEQNIRFLQEQHQLMLGGLHQEIDNLRQRNRDLQFQLVFSKGQIVSPNSASPSSPEEEAKTRVLSPKQVNITPLQVELLERELGELKITLHEINTRNVYLTAIVDEQKKKLERFEKEKEQPVRPEGTDPDLLNKLDDVETLVRKLRRENDDLRREMNDTRATHGSSASGPPNRGGGRHHRGGNHHYRGHRFPPLHTQSYWQGGREKDGEGTSAGTQLPNLHMNNGGGVGAGHHHHHQQQQQQQQQQHLQQPTNNSSQQHYIGAGSGGGGGTRRTGANNNHHHHHHHYGGGGPENRKYRGGQSRGAKS